MNPSVQVLECVHARGSDFWMVVYLKCMLFGVCVCAGNVRQRQMAAAAAVRDSPSLSESQRLHLTLCRLTPATSTTPRPFVVHRILFPNPYIRLSHCRICDGFKLNLEPPVSDTVEN